MRTKKKFIAALFILSTPVFSTTQPAPTYLPGGTIQSFSRYDLMNPFYDFKERGWWYLVGLIHDQDNASHSLEIMIDRFNIANITAGLGGIGFTFKNTQGQNDYLWNAYPSSEMVPYYAFGQLNSAPADSRTFFIAANPFLSNNTFAYRFEHDAADMEHAVGDIDANYFFRANGVAEVGASTHHLQLVQYTLELNLKDTRGIVPEGMNGYVGAIKPEEISNTINSWEFAMPNLTLTHWKMTITPLNTPTTESPVTHAISFNGNSDDDSIWLDRQILYHAKVITNTRDPRVLFSNTLRQSPLYRGTWISFCLKKGVLKNICGDVAAFWAPGIQTEHMDTDQNATFGFANLFTPDSNTKDFPIQVGNTLTETLSVNGDEKILPFRIQNNSTSITTSLLSGHRYAQTVFVTFKKGTLFSGVLDSTSENLNNDHDYVLKFTTLSSLAENIPGDYSGGFYEGATRVSLCHDDDQSICEDVGTGFMEEMGY